MGQIFRDVEQWLGKRPRWLQDAAFRIITNNTITEKDLQELVELCKSEAGINTTNNVFTSVKPGSLSSMDESTHLKLVEIHNVKGISALGPKKPLSFGSSLSIVYGQNGSGKSSYVRLLKHISGAKKSKDLIGNVYVTDQQPQSCSLTVTNNEEIKEISWTPELGTLDELNTLQLYDTDCANVYVNEENEVAYEPWLLLFFSQLTDVSLKVGQVIKQEMDSITQSNLSYPEGSSKTQSISWLTKINEKTTDMEIIDKCSWHEHDEVELNEKKQHLVVADPIEKMKQYETKLKSMKFLHKVLTDAKNSLSEDACINIIRAKLDLTVKKRAAEEDARKVFDNLPLDGIGTDSWRLLWEQARLFSEEHAYKKEQFPFTSVDANCVLCQQPLSTEAQFRLNSFEIYIKESLSNQAKSADQLLTTLLKEIKEIPNEETLTLHFNSLDMTVDEKKYVLDFCSTLERRNQSLKEEFNLDLLLPLPSEDILSSITESVATQEQHAVTYEKLSKLDNRDELKTSILELESRKWLHQYQVVIDENVNKLKSKAKLKKAITLTNTQTLSLKKSSLSDLLITEEYIQRFQKELKELGGSRINVDLVKTRAAKGHIYHQIKLKNCSTSVQTSEVLSEGEFRIVSLAGFLADVESSSNNTPFIFDDPISSLDQIFEEATVKRIAKLSLSRQVIVFTHRLSFLTLLEEAAKKMSVQCDVIWLRAESWGTGEPGETPVFARKPENALNLILHDRLPKARRVFLDEGRLEYDLLAKGICSDFRILLERFIENDLLGDVVQRFRRSVNTQGKLHKLAHISQEDCKLFEDYMTKYSTYEHSQSYETPVPLPEPDELKADMERIKSWLGDFKKRTNS